jgi:hypothetical protein
VSSAVAAMGAAANEKTLRTTTSAVRALVRPSEIKVLTIPPIEFIGTKGAPAIFRHKYFTAPI